MEFESNDFHPARSPLGELEDLSLMTLELIELRLSPLTIWVRIKRDQFNHRLTFVNKLMKRDGHGL
jgi:hypothetical protein